jgi:hypothetical protein
MNRSLLTRLLNRLTGRAQLDRLEAVAAKVGQLGRAHRDELAAQRHRLDRLIAAVSTRAGADGLKAVERRLERLETALAQQERTTTDALARAARLDSQGVDDRRFARRIEHLLRGDGPVVVGPWTGEVGFELLYWVPFVRWTVETFGIDPARLTIVSRGGVHSWYGLHAARYLDLFRFVSPAEFRAATIDAKKQRRVGAFDREIVERLRAEAGLADAGLLHPGLMYRLLNPFFREDATAARVEAYTRYATIEAPADRIVDELPREYVAVRFYGSDCFPDTAANRTFAASAIESLSRQLPVVLLDAPFDVDDHHGMGGVTDVLRASARGGARVLSIADRMTPDENLRLQTAVIARARAFVGTYGGYSYLAPFHGVSAVAFYSEPAFKPSHLHLAQRVFGRLGRATLLPLAVDQSPLVQLAAQAPASVRI